MRVVEPRQFEENNRAKKKSRRIVKFFAIIPFLVLGVWLYQRSQDPAAETNSRTETEEQVEVAQSEVTPPEDTVKDTLRRFTDNEFKVFYDNLLQPNLERVENPPTITGNDIADARIRKVAEDRGYRLRSSPNVDLVSVDGYLLQPVISEPWQALKTASLEAGLQMSIVSGYRSVAEQRQLFMSRLYETGVSLNQIANGTADSEIDFILQTTAIPGYSKHHTGYTFDLYCAGFQFEKFRDSTCNTWLAADNYKVAKELGFIPSYPPLSDSQGPNPEAWEYIYVGTELLYE